MNTKTIMVIEDNDFIRVAVQQIIEDEGYRTEVATNGREALELLERQIQLPALILLDLNMPIMDGWHFRSLQKENLRLQSIPVVVFTADGNASEKAEKIKAQGWLRKPIEVDDLLKILHKYCG